MLKLSTHNNPVVSFKSCLIFGIPVALVSIVLMFTNPSAQNNLPPGFSTPIMALEFIQNRQEAIALFEVENRTEYIEKFLLGNKIDYLFMVLYGSFMMCIAYKIALITRNRTLYFAMLLGLLAIVTDFLENQTIHSIILNYNEESAGNFIGRLRLFTWAKWGSIAVFFFITAGYFWRGNLFSKLISVVGVTTFLVSIAAFIYRSILNEIMGLLVAVNFLLIIIFCFVQKKVKVDNL